MPELLSIIAEYLPELIAGLIFLYALIALLLNTFQLTARIMRARACLADVVTRDQLLAVFAQTGLKRLGPRIVDPAPSGGPMRDPALIRSRFGFEPARREIGRLYRDRLVRVQFFTSIAGLLAIAAVGWMQNYLHISKFGIGVPAWPAFVAALVLVLFFATCRLSIDAAAQSLLARISELPFSSRERTLLTAAEGNRAGSAAAAGSSDSSVGAVAPILEAIAGLTEVIESSRSSLREPMMQLAASADALAVMAKAISEHPANAAAATAHASVGEEFKTAIDRLATRMEQLAERAVDAAPTGEELRTAIERLAMRIEQLAERSADPASAVPYASVGEELKTAIDRLTAKIEQLAKRPADTAHVAGEELKAAIDRLAARIEQLAVAPIKAAAEAESHPRRSAGLQVGDLQELRDLLKEFE